jgi:hypothetical protein
LSYGVKYEPIKNPASSPKAVKQTIITNALAALQLFGANFITFSANSKALSTISITFNRDFLIMYYLLKK